MKTIFMFFLGVDKASELPMSSIAEVQMSSGAGAGGGAAAHCPFAKRGTGTVLPFAFKYDSNEAKLLLCNL